jgi:adenylosuccinate synthase
MRAMPATVIVGGQFGSEGKGKVAEFWARKTGARAAVRVGGSNSGHTTLAGADGERRVLRQLPTAALLPDVLCVLPPGSYIDPDVLLREIGEVGLVPERLVIDPLAMLISPADIAAERAGVLGPEIGSTCSGTGAAVARRIARLGREQLAGGHPSLQPYLGSSGEVLRRLLDRGDRVVLEGTQGFGLSLLHSPHYPKVTSRDTTAAAVVAEAGLSPRDVDEVVLVTRAFPIRVAGASGPFGAPELDWGTIAAEGGHTEALSEFTSVTGRLRRVARFDPILVSEAIRANQPSALVLNHVDYIDAGTRGGLTETAAAFLAGVVADLGRAPDYVGLGPDSLLAFDPALNPAVAI